MSAFHNKNMNQYKNVSALQVLPVSKSITRDVVITDQSNANANAIQLEDISSENKYWWTKFGLSSSATNSKQQQQQQSTTSKCVTLQCGSASMVRGLVSGTVYGITSRRQSMQSHNHVLVACCGPRVLMYGTSSASKFHKTLRYGRKSNVTIEQDKQISTNGQVVNCVSLRADGRLLIIGCANGTIKLCDTSTSRSTLMTFQCNDTASTKDTHSSNSVQGLCWFRDGQHILSGCNDGALRVWCIKSSNTNNSSNPIFTCIGHGDSIKCVELWEKTTVKNDQKRIYPYHAIAATGSYDHTVRLWNMEQLDDAAEDQRCLAVLNHGSPVEAIRFVKAAAGSDSPPVWLLSIGGVYIKTWNIFTGRCVSTIRTYHSKTITCAMVLHKQSSNAKQSEPNRHRFVTGGLDGFLRIHTWDLRTGALEHLHGIRMNNTPITSMVATATNDRIAIGLMDGSVTVRQIGIAPKQSPAAEPTAGTYAYFTRCKNVPASEEDAVVVMEGGAKKRKKAANYDVSLRAFRYSDALDEAMATRRPSIVLSVLEELGRRHGLIPALSNRTEDTLEPILSFIIKYLTSHITPTSTAVLIGITNTILRIYCGGDHGTIQGQSNIIDEQLLKLRTSVRNELAVQKKIFGLLGQLQ